MKRMKIILFVLPVLYLLLAQCKKETDNKPDLTRGLLAYFPLQFNSNFDSLGNVPSLAATGAISIAVDRHAFNNAVYFNGGKLVGKTPKWKIRNFTVSLWLFFGSTTTAGYVMMAGNGSFGFFQDNTNLGFMISQPYTNSAMGYAGAGWMHVAGTYDGKTIRTYVDGKLVAEKDHAGTPADVTEFILGQNNTSLAWKGGLDDLRFYNRVLTYEEIGILASF